MNFTQTYIKLEHERLKQRLLSSKLPEVESLLVLNATGWKKICEHGDFQRWSDGLDSLPDAYVEAVDLNDTVCVKGKTDLQQLESSLHALRPWRKGPFDLFGVHIDTEWHSDWKWDRLIQHITPMQGRRVLDIGCGSGYHLWRMVGENAGLAIGIDPSPLFSFHFAALKRYIPDAPAFLIPTGVDEMPKDMDSFDTVFSMGILYHRKSPVDHLYQLKSFLKEGGELVLETLVVDGDKNTCLIPEGRYAKMRNVWFIPSISMIEIWLKRVGFKNIRCVDVNVTSTEEQRVTNWMQFESLADFLDPDDCTKTVEGHPAPKRAVILANR